MDRRTAPPSEPSLIFFRRAFQGRMFNTGSTPALLLQQFNRAIPVGRGRRRTEPLDRLQVL